MISVMFIEVAMDGLKNRDSKLLASEIKEFSELGPLRLSEVTHNVGLSVPDAVLDPMTVGYLLGLETARVLLATNIKAVQAGVEL